MKTKYEKPKMEQMEPIDIICVPIGKSNPRVITRHVFPELSARGMIYPCKNCSVKLNEESYSKQEEFRNEI